MGRTSLVVTQPSWAYTLHILVEQAEPLLGIVGSALGVVGIMGDQLVGVVDVAVGVVYVVVGDQLVGDQVGPGYCGQRLLQASHSLSLPNSQVPSFPFPSMLTVTTYNSKVRSLRRVNLNSSINVPYRQPDVISSLLSVLRAVSWLS